MSYKGLGCGSYMGTEKAQATTLSDNGTVESFMRLGPKIRLNVFSEGYRSYLALCLTSSVSQSVSVFLFLGAVARRRAT